MKLQIIFLSLIILFTSNDVFSITLIPESSFEGSGPESDGWTYTNSYCTKSPCPYFDVSTDVSHSGSKSLKGTYSAAWSDPNPQINTVGIYKSFSGQTDVYLRYYYYTIGFTYGVSNTKHVYFKGTPGYPNGGPINWFGSRELGWGLQNSADCGYTSCNLYPNMASKPLADNIWYCVEAHFKLNDVGVSNGMVEVWIDGVQTLGYYNRTFKGTLANGPNGNSSEMVFDTLEPYKQNGDGLMYYDQLIAATTRIGCGSSSADTTPPFDVTTISVSPGSTFLDISWGSVTDNPSGPVSYILQSCTGSGCSNYGNQVTVNTTNYTVSALAPSTTMRFRVKAVDGSGNPSTNWSPIASGTTPSADTTPPSKPSNFTVK